MGISAATAPEESSPVDIGLTPSEGVTNMAPIFRVQAGLLIGGAVVGFLGVILPHPEDFLVPHLVIANIISVITAVWVYLWADRLPGWIARIGPAVGSIMVTVAVVFSRDPTSAYALLYIFPAVYSYYFLRTIDSVAHLSFAVINYAIAIAILTQVDGASATAAGSIAHHFVVTVGMVIVVGVMLLYLRRRVERLVREIVASARTDLQTGLRNQRGLTEQLDGELERARMNGLRVTVLNLRLTGLRKTRSHLGSGAVDALLGEVARLLSESVRGLDTVARVNPNEFAMVLVETDESTGFMLAEQVLSRLRRAFRETDARCAASIGVASFPKHGANSEVVMRAAGTASEAAVSLGSDRAVVYSAELADVVSDDPASAFADRRNNLTAVLSMAEVLELRDEATASHSLMVSRYAEEIGRRLGLHDSRLSRIRLAGMLHDIGKIGISDSILKKPGPLSPQEWDEVRKHPQMAARILGAKDLTDIREWILARHEQPDGHGYPRGLKGEQIPIESRILAVAESYDAMTNERPYRRAMSRDEAIAEIGRYVGTQFDGAVVDALVTVVRSSPHLDGVEASGG